MFKKKKAEVIEDDQTGPFVEVELASDYAYVPGYPMEGTVHLNSTHDIMNVDKVSLQLLEDEIAINNKRDNNQKITLKR